MKREPATTEHERILRQLDH